GPGAGAPVVWRWRPRPEAAPPAGDAPRLRPVWRLPRPGPDDLLSGSAPGHALDGPDSLLARRAPRGAAPVRHRDPPRRDGRPRRPAPGGAGPGVWGAGPARPARG